MTVVSERLNRLFLAHIEGDDSDQPDIRHAPGSTDVDHDDLTGVSADDHHTENHADSKHTEPPILKSLLDAKGDLIIASANDTPARFPVGTNDQILMADSAQALGHKWASPGVPLSIGTFNVEGVADTYSRGDHIHARVESLGSGTSYTKSTPNGTEQAEATLYQLPQLAANSLQVGQIYVVRLNGVVTVNSNQPLMDFRWRFGPNATDSSNTQITLLNTFTSNSTTNAGWWLEATMRVVSIGATGTLIGHMHYYTEMSTQFSAGQEQTNQTVAIVVDTTVANYLGFTADWSQHGTGHVLTATTIF